MIGQRPRLADCLPEIPMFWQTDGYFVSVQQARVLIQEPRDAAHPSAVTDEKLTFGHATVIASTEHHSMNVWACKTHPHNRGTSRLPAELGSVATD